MALKAVKKLIEDLESGVQAVVSDYATTAANAGTAAYATTASWGGTSLRAKGTAGTLLT